MEKILQDIHFLAETLEHRLPATEQEEQAANYVLKRLKPFVDYAQKTTFGAIENFRLVLAAYYGEFVVTCLLAFWWPTVACIYGFGVFLAYMAESLGYPVFSRLLTFYESSSVLGFRQGDNPERLLVFTAYLDTDNASFADTSILPLFRFLNRLLTAIMILVLATCLVDALAVWQGTSNPFTWWIRLAGLVVFLFAALTTFLGSLNRNITQGANHNASGIAALLEIAERICKRRIRQSSVLFYFSGAHFANMAGMRALVKEISSAYEEVFIINIEGVGAGSLCYTESEGVLRKTACAPQLVEIAQRLSKRHRVRPVRMHNYATNAYLPLLHGYKAISILGLDDNEFPVNYGSEEDTSSSVSAESVIKAARFAESVARCVVKEAMDKDVENDLDA